MGKRNIIFGWLDYPEKCKLHNSICKDIYNAEFNIYFPDIYTRIFSSDSNICDFWKTRMTTFIKTKFKKSDDQTNIEKYRVAANIISWKNVCKNVKNQHV